MRLFHGALIASCLISGACSRPAQQSPLLSTPQDLLGTLEDAIGFGRSWILEHTPVWKAVLCRSEEGSLPLRVHSHAAVRILLVEGSVRARVGAAERILGPGSLLSVPPRTPYRLRRAAHGPVTAVFFYSPDFGVEEPIEQSSR